MTDEDDGRITDARVERMRSRVGVELDDASYLDADPEVAAAWRPQSEGFNHEVTADGSRHFAHGYGDDNPLYCEPDHGPTTRWGTLIAPATFCFTMGGTDEVPRQLRPEVAQRLKGDPLRGVGKLQANLHFEFYRPLELGDRLYTRRGLIGVGDKRSSWGGRVVHEWNGIASRNQRGQLVHSQRGMWIRAERRATTEKAHPQPPPEPYSEEQLAEIDAAYAAETRRGAEPLWWEDVEVGDPLPQKVKGPYRLTDVILWHAGFGQGFPTHAFKLAHRTRTRTPALYTPNALNVPDIVQRMHWEADWAHAVGAPAPYDYGALRESFLANLLSDWMGDDGWLWQLDVQHRKFLFIGDTAWLRGHVADKRQVDGRSEVHLELRVENQRGLVLSPASAIVLLPSREQGPVVLPDPGAEHPAELLRRHAELIAAHERDWYPNDWDGAA